MFSPNNLKDVQILSWIIGKQALHMYSRPQLCVCIHAV